ncbi:MAG: glycerophosphodiester phosphodiesterase [Myxococcota bacterium]
MKHLRSAWLALGFLAACAGSTDAVDPGSDADAGGDVAHDAAAADLPDAAGPGPHACFGLGRPTQVIAHRGGALLRPEHTLLAYDHALEIGADVIELDLHASADGVVVVIHDTTVDRTTEGTGRVDGLSFEALQDLDAAYRFEAGGVPVYRGQGVKIPSFEQVLARHPGACMSLELKTDSLTTAQSVLDLLDSHDAAGHVLIVSFIDEPLAYIRIERPDILTGLSLTEMVEFQTLDDSTAPDWRAPGQIWQPPMTSVRADTLARAHAAGLIAQPWTVNTPADMTRLLDLGVDGIITDDPATLLDVLGRGPQTR